MCGSGYDDRVDSQDPTLLTLDVVGPELGEVAAPSNQATANRAKSILCDSGPRFRDVTPIERSAVAAAFAARNFVVYGKAFDLVEADPELVLGDQDSLTEAIKSQA